MKPEQTAWLRLTTAARQVRDDRETAAPYGFATRVAARAMAGPKISAEALFERFSWRALGLAGLLALISVATNYSAVASSNDDDVFANDVVVTELFDLY
ncbi:hypothetical protein [Opitutus terrae]|uniref:Uncharacterized protein n=1 Tax=Opitutus terrae (strain DSM 11246 / JCM 15787 / PB90-1) TaxID=452637 RepID=B2A0B4_OPITP|nr:hypothetical protein [Opitutus terrae]ACB77450.1 hypothetical protein Oter_4177 [Opitutus terrae PB90-1]